ncbi:MAG: polyphenol oxidase family protein [Myxococcales bacterium]|nr:polyphenol oxidase family protein [Myxococcales bacterium]
MSLQHALLDAAGVEHGFGTRTSPPPDSVERPRQVHGAVVAEARANRVCPEEADAVWTDEPRLAVGIVTADCVPILVAESGGARVAAIHAGWRGLAAGVVTAALTELLRRGAASGDLVAAVGPCVGGCCYEVDEPVLRALGRSFGDELGEACCPTRPGHARVDLGALAVAELSRILPQERVGLVENACTQCDPVRFHSYRRDGRASGRLLHWVRSPARVPSGG